MRLIPSMCSHLLRTDKNGNPRVIFCRSPFDVNRASSSLHARPHLRFSRDFLVLVRIVPLNESFREGGVFEDMDEPSLSPMANFIPVQRLDQLKEVLVGAFLQAKQPVSFFLSKKIPPNFDNKSLNLIKNGIPEISGEKKTR